MPNQIPGSASMFTTPACVVGSQGGSAVGHSAGRLVWLGLVAGAAAASVTFWGSNASTGGASPILTLNALTGTTVPMQGPFALNASGLYVGNITTGSAVVWMH